MLTLPLLFAYISNTVFSYTHYQSRIFLTWSQHTLNPSVYIYHIELARDLDLSDLQYLLAQDSLGDEKDLDLESPFPTVTQVEVEETVVDLPPEQVRRIVDLRDYDPNAVIDIENPDDLQLQHAMCKISIYSNFFL